MRCSPSLRLVPATALTQSKPEPAASNQDRSKRMQASIFNLRVPVANDEVFLMNTLTDAQIVVSQDVIALLDRIHTGGRVSTDEEHDAAALLEEHGFLV